MNATHSTKTKKGRLYAYDYYRCSSRNNHGVEACPNSKRPRAEELEDKVWVFVSGLLKDPDQLRADLERMIELEREGVHGDPEREVKTWLDKLSEVDCKRARFQDMAAEGLINFEELRTKLAALDETRVVAERELETLKSRQEYLESLERDRDAILENYMHQAPAVLEELTPKERHRLYKMLRLEVLICSDGPPEITWAFEVPTSAATHSSVKSEDSERSARTVGL